MELNHSEPAISIEDLHFAYPHSNNSVINGLNVKIHKGERIAILGPNGAGKSTLFSIITGLTNHYSGEVKLYGKSIRTMLHHHIASILSFVPQKHEPLFPFSVKDFILMGRYSKIGILGNPTKEDLKAVEKAAIETGAIKYFDRPYNELSGGEIQLAVIARALAQETEILILDEPSNHLDFKNQFAILKLISDISKKRNTTLIMSLHNPNDVLLFAERAIILDKGVCAADGKVSEILNTEILNKVFGIQAICLQQGEQKAFLPQALA